MIMNNDTPNKNNDIRITHRKRILRFIKEFGPVVPIIGLCATNYSILHQLNESRMSKLDSEVQEIYVHKQEVNKIMLDIDKKGASLESLDNTKSKTPTTNVAPDKQPTQGGPQGQLPEPKTILAYYMLNDYDRFYTQHQLGLTKDSCVWKEIQDMIYTAISQEGGIVNVAWNENKGRVKRSFSPKFQKFVEDLTKSSNVPNYIGTSACRSKDSPDTMAATNNTIMQTMLEAPTVLMSKL